MKKSITKSIVSLLLIVTLFISAINISVFAINQRWRYSFEKINAMNDWVAKYGGSIKRVHDKNAPNGEYYLQMTGRSKSWHSPAIKLDDILEQGGPGSYAVAVWVKVSDFGESGRKFGRSIIRGVETTSITQYHEPNYFSVVQSATIEPDTWTYIQGSFSVASDDIHRGEFYWMLDCIDPVDGQIVCIDDFHIFKVSDVVSLPGEKVDSASQTINDKPFLDYYYYENMPNYDTEDERAAWYYTQLNNSQLYWGEVIFTFSHDTFNQLVNDYLNNDLNDWWKEQSDTQIELIKDSTLAIVTSMITHAPNLDSSKLDLFISAVCKPADFTNVVNKLSSLYKSDLSRLAVTFANTRDEGSYDTGAQDGSTVSIYLMRSDYAKYEYKICHSSQRGVLDKNQYGELDKETYTFLLNDLMYRLTGGYTWDGTYKTDGTPKVNLAYYKYPTINKVLRGYSYINEYNYLTMKGSLT